MDPGILIIENSKSEFPVILHFGRKKNLTYQQQEQFYSLHSHSKE